MRDFIRRLHRPISFGIASLMAYLFNLIVVPLTGEIFRAIYKAFYAIFFGTPRWTNPIQAWIYSKGLAEVTEYGFQFANSHSRFILSSFGAVLMHFPIDNLLNRALGPEPQPQPVTPAFQSMTRTTSSTDSSSDLNVPAESPAKKRKMNHE